MGKMDDGRLVTDQICEGGKWIIQERGEDKHQTPWTKYACKELWHG